MKCVAVYGAEIQACLEANYLSTHNLSCLKNQSRLHSELLK